MTISAECARCGGRPFFLTCAMTTGSDHDWALAIICPGCHQITWTDEGCLDCQALAEERR